MRASHETYIDEIRKHVDLVPTWPANLCLRVGDVISGDLRNVRYDGSSVKKWKVQKGQRSDSLTYSSASGVTAEIDAGTQNPPLVTVKVGFAIEGGVYARMTGATLVTTKERAQMEEFLLVEYKAGRWPIAQWLVTETMEAETLMCFVSASASAQVSVELAPRSTTPGGTIRLSKSMALEMIVSKPCTPLFRAIRINDPWYASPRVGERGSGNTRAGGTSTKRQSVRKEKPTVEDVRF